MIDRLLGDADLSAETRARVVAAAEGNPLYVEQIVSMARENGSSEIVVPPTISALLAARLDNLTREERAIVEPASVIGLVFFEAAVEAMVPTTLQPTVPGHLTDLDRKQFVHPMAGGDDETFRFHHILVRDAAYQSLLKRARATLHERFVRWAEPVNRERGRETEFEEILGYHLEQAVRYRSELGPLDATGQEVADRASGKLASAGRRAFARGDTPAACSLLRRAAVLRPPDDPVRIELLTELADALSEEGEFDEAATSLRDAIDSAERIGDARLRDRARLAERGLELSTSGGAGIADVVGEAEGAIASFEAAGDEAGLARAWRLLMLVHGTAGRYDQAAVAAEQVARHARAAGDVLLATRGSPGYAASALHGPTPVDDAIATGQRLADEVSGDRKAEAIMLGVLGQLHAMAGNFDEARDRARRGLAMLLELGPEHHRILDVDRVVPDRDTRRRRRGRPRGAAARLRRARGGRRDVLPGVDRGAARPRPRRYRRLGRGGAGRGPRPRHRRRRRRRGPDPVALGPGPGPRGAVTRRRGDPARGGGPRDRRLDRRPRPPGRRPRGARGGPRRGRQPRAATWRRARALALYEQKGSRAGRARLLDHRPEATTRLT
jgi:tetratricopeptide (TPR) repeat protein